MDIIDLSYQDCLTLLDKYNQLEDLNSIKKYLDNWDGTMDFHYKAARIYEHLRREIEHEAQLFASNDLGLKKAPSFKYFIEYLIYDNISIEGAEPKEAMVRNIVRRVDSIIKDATLLEKEFESLKINNISFLPGFAKTLPNKVGNRNTINMSSNVLPVFRSIYKMDSTEIQGYSIMAGGQSGKMNSIHYMDQLEGWYNGSYHSTQFVDNPDLLKDITTLLEFKKQ